MPANVKPGSAPPPKRPYDASRRHADAERTRRHVIDVAAPLFAEHGYEPTSIRQVADAAGVAPQTIYNAFGSKFGLFSAVVDVVVAGDHEPVALADRPEHVAVEDLGEPRQIVDALVATSTPILARLAVMYPTLRAAAATDPEVAVADQRFTLDARYADLERVVRRLQKLRALRDGMTAREATDIVWTIISPDSYDLLVRHRGWTPRQFAGWATRTLTSTILQPTA